jgi:hypothetical protein
MEPTIGLEPMTCRLRIDPVLRMLLCDNDRTRAFWGVFGCSGDPLYSNCTAGYVLIERHDIQNRLFLTPAANRRSLADIFSETTLTESLRKIRVCRIRGDLGNSIDIVGRTDFAAALSVMRSAVVLPPTKTNSARSGFRRRAASVSSWRLCFDIFSAESAYQLSFGDFAFTCSPIPDRIHQSEKLVQNGIAERRCGGGPI